MKASEIRVSSSGFSRRVLTPPDKESKRIMGVWKVTPKPGFEFRGRYIVPKKPYFGYNAGLAIGFLIGMISTFGILILLK